jgi:hypothetical protein
MRIMRWLLLLSILSLPLLSQNPPGGGVIIVPALPATCSLAGLYEYANNFYGCAPANTLSIFQSSSSGVNAVVGTASQITATSLAGTVTLSIPSAFTFPGTATIGGTFTNNGSYAGSAIVPVLQGGTGTSTPGLIQGTNITITGIWPNQTINSSGGGGGGGLGSGPSAPITPSGGNATLAFTGTVSANTIAISGAVNVVLPTPTGNASGPFTVKIKNTAPTANPVTWTGTCSVNIPQAASVAANEVTIFTIGYFADESCWRVQAAVDTSAAALTSGDIMVSQGTIGPPTGLVPGTGVAAALARAVNGTSGNICLSDGTCGGVSGAKLNFGFDFRNTSGFAKDPANFVFATDQTTNAGMAYPHTFTNALGVSLVCGWDSGGASVVSRDRTGANDQTLSGVVLLSSGTATFRCDLPAAGYYTVISAWGDPGNVETLTGLITDNGTTRVSVTATTTGGATGTFADTASLVSQNWTQSNVSVGVNFTSTVFRVALTPGSGFTGLMHLALVQQ